MKTVEETRAFQLLQRLESDGVLQSRPDLSRQIILGLGRHLESRLPPEGKAWLAAGEAYSRGEISAASLERARVEAWEHLGDESSNFTSPRVNAVRMVICGLFPDQEKDAQQFDLLTNALEFFLGAKGNSEVAAAVIAEAFGVE